MGYLVAKKKNNSRKSKKVTRKKVKISLAK
jgi:hypothetical protein